MSRPKIDERVATLENKLFIDSIDKGATIYEPIEIPTNLDDKGYSTWYNSDRTSFTIHSDYKDTINTYMKANGLTQVTCIFNIDLLECTRYISQASNPYISFSIDYSNYTIVISVNIDDLSGTSDAYTFSNSTETTTLNIPIKLSDIDYTIRLCTNYNTGNLLFDSIIIYPTEVRYSDPTDYKFIKSLYKEHAFTINFSNTVNNTKDSVVVNMGTQACCVDNVDSIPNDFIEGGIAFIRSDN
jgi:hypothetical protein